jgi:hypothetical protein
MQQMGERRSSRLPWSSAAFRRAERFSRARASRSSRSSSLSMLLSSSLLLSSSSSSLSSCGAGAHSVVWGMLTGMMLKCRCSTSP